MLMYNGHWNVQYKDFSHAVTGFSIVYLHFNATMILFVEMSTAENAIILMVQWKRSIPVCITVCASN